MASKQQELLRAATVSAQETKQRLEEEIMNAQSRNSAMNQQHIQLKEQLEKLEGKHAKVLRDLLSNVKFVEPLHCYCLC